VGITTGVRELAEEAGEQNVEALVVLLHARDKALACCSELSMATVRWRPSRAPGSRGAHKRGQRGEGKRAGQGEDDAWKGGEQEVDGGGRGSGTGGRAEEAGDRGGLEEEEEREKVRRTCVQN
jgi:hypothetical protein